MKKSELKAKFRRYSAEEKWQHYFACKKKIKMLKKEKQELEEYSSLYHKCLMEEADLQTKVTSQKMRWAELKEYLKNQITDLRHIDIKTKTQSLRVNDAVNCFRQVLCKMQELEKEYE